ncbi:MAG: hypothetical protein AAGA92_15780, partial [Planctomycetota bacterium]
EKLVELMETKVVYVPQYPMFKASPGFAGFHLALTDANNFYQAGGQFFTPIPSDPFDPETFTYSASLSDFSGQNAGEPGFGVPLTDLGFVAGDFARFNIASNTDGDGFFEIDNFRLITRDVIESADFDLDSNTDADDLAALLAAFGGNNDGDADFDADTDVADLLSLQRLFGGGSPISAVSTPEPSTAAIALLFGLAAATSRRRVQ